MPRNKDKKPVGKLPKKAQGTMPEVQADWKPAKKKQRKANK